MAHERTQSKREQRIAFDTNLYAMPGNASKDAESGTVIVLICVASIIVSPGKKKAGIKCRPSFRDA